MNFSIDTFILLGTFLLILLGFFVIGFVVYYQRKQFRLEIKQNEENQRFELELQRKLLENSMEVQENERRRLAKDLHDEVGAVLSVLKMGNNQLIKKSVGLDELGNLASNNKDLIEESISLVRNISKDLVPQTLENFGLIVALEEFFNKMEKNSEIHFQLRHQGIAEKVRFSPTLELSIYRIIQELSNNAIKHSNATLIELDLFYKNAILRINFKDNGKGFSLEEVKNNPKSGLGIRNIESRLSVVNGKLDVKLPSEGGVLFEIEIKDVLSHE